MLAAIPRSPALFLCAIALVAVSAAAQEPSVPAAEVAMYRVAFAALSPPPAGMTGTVFKVNRLTRDDTDLVSLPTDGWTCQDGSDAAAALARYAALPAGRPGEVLPPEAMVPGYRLVSERSRSDRMRGLYHGGDAKYEVGEVTASALRRAPDGSRAAVLFVLALPEYGLVELEMRGGAWSAIRLCGPPLPGAAKRP